jgi:hypothetical protein
MRDFVYCGYTYQVAYDDLPFEDGPDGRTSRLRKWMERQGYHATITTYEKKTRWGKRKRKMILVTPQDRQCPTHQFAPKEIPHTMAHQQRVHTERGGRHSRPRPRLSR